MKALIIKEFRELARDRRTLAMLLALPVLLLVIFGYAANFSVEKVTVAVIGPDAEAIAAELAATDTAAETLDIVLIDAGQDGGQAEPLLRDRSANTVVVAQDGDAGEPLLDRIEAYVDGSRLFAAQAAQRAFAQLAAEQAQDRVAEAQSSVEEARASAETQRQELERFAAELAAFRTAITEALATGTPIPEAPTPPESAGLPQLPEFGVPTLGAEDTVTVLFNPELRTSWVMIPGLIGLILTFIGTVITSIGLVRERETGTLEQLAVMPLQPSAIILGKITPYFLLAVVDMALITALGVGLFGVPFLGEPWLFALTAVVFLFVVLGVGVLISSVSQNTGQAIQLAIMVVLPQTLLSGLIFPLDSMAAGVRWIGYLLPLTWFNEAAQGILLRGAGPDALWLPLLILTAQAVLIFGVATARMRFSLSHGGARA